VSDQIRDKLPKLSQRMDEAETDVLAYKRFPAAHWPKISSTNPIERPNAEIKRRTDVVGVFPNEVAILHLVGAVDEDVGEVPGDGGPRLVVAEDADAVGDRTGTETVDPEPDLDPVGEQHLGEEARAARRYDRDLGAVAHPERADLVQAAHDGGVEIGVEHGVVDVSEGVDVVPARRDRREPLERASLRRGAAAGGLLSVREGGRRQENAPVLVPPGASNPHTTSPRGASTSLTRPPPRRAVVGRDLGCGGRI
jgi:hypothetical protein